MLKQKSLPGVGGTQIRGYVAENATELVDKGLKDRKPKGGGNKCVIRKIGLEEDLRPPECMVILGRSPRTTSPLGLLVPGRYAAIYLADSMGVPRRDSSALLHSRKHIQEMHVFLSAPICKYE